MLVGRADYHNNIGLAMLLLIDFVVVGHNLLVGWLSATAIGSGRDRGCIIWHVLIGIRNLVVSIAVKGRKYAG